MRRIIYGMFASLDGYIAGPNGELDWPVIDEELHRYVNEQERAIDTLLYGRRMYEVMSYWSTADADPSLPEYELEFARIWQRADKIVFSRTLERIEGNARLMRDVDPQEIAAIKARPGKDIEVGGADLAATFMRLGLIDEYHAYVHPIVLGGGTPMFAPSRDRVPLRLVETRTFTSGVVLLRYEPQR